jgi:hypothetical protein
MGELLQPCFGRLPLLFGLSLWDIHCSFRGLDG